MSPPPLQPSLPLCRGIELRHGSAGIRLASVLADSSGGRRGGGAGNALSSVTAGLGLTSLADELPPPPVSGPPPSPPTPPGGALGSRSPAATWSRPGPCGGSGTGGGQDAGAVLTPRRHSKDRQVHVDPRLEAPSPEAPPRGLPTSTFSSSSPDSPVLGAEFHRGEHQVLLILCAVHPAGPFRLETQSWALRNLLGCFLDDFLPCGLSGAPIMQVPWGLAISPTSLCYSPLILHLRTGAL